MYESHFVQPWPFRIAGIAAATRLQPRAGARAQSPEPAPQPAIAS